MAGVLHVLNGDSAAGTLRRSILPGTCLAYADALHDGPVPEGLDDNQLRDVRARFIAGSEFDSYAAVLSQFREWDATLERFREYGEVVLWFEHDLFDQLLLIRHLDWFARRDRGIGSGAVRLEPGSTGAGETRLSLICIGEFPGIEPFHGLGQLTAGQLVSLFPDRTQVTAAQLALGRRAWAAFKSADPHDIARLLADDTTALPFLAGALTRHLEEFPATANGLSRTEREILKLLTDGPLDTASLFKAEQRREERVYMGDAWFWKRVETLAAPPRPLVVLKVEPRTHQLPQGTVAINELGRKVLSGGADRVAIAGIDRWLGGVHLTPGRLWRWDEERRRLSESASG